LLRGTGTEDGGSIPLTRYSLKENEGLTTAPLNSSRAPRSSMGQTSTVEN